MVMVKPALAYLDIVREAASLFHFPLAAYAVSGEYSMIQLAAQQGLVDEKRVVLEVLTSLVRAGARTVISYHTKKIAVWHRESQIHILQGLATF
jgi:porphobilinogen synthase